jgi:hypothetical protein
LLGLRTFCLRLPCPKTSYVGSAEYRAEAEQEARREREIKRRMSGICSGC